MTDPRAIHGPPTNSVAGTEHLPWAVNGTTLEPGIAEETAGHEPYGVGAPPDYRHENYHRRALFEWLLRAEQAAIWLPRNIWSATIGGTVDVGDQRRVTINANNVDHTVGGETTNDAIAKAIADAINLDPTTNPVVFAYNEGAIVYLVGKGVALDVAVSVSVLTDAGTTDATITAAELEGGPYTARPTEQNASITDLSIVWGSNQMDDTGNPAQDRRMFFDAVNRAFRAGEVTGTEWDARGTYSVAFGYNNAAAGANSFAHGVNNDASAAHAKALGNANTCSATQTLAIGDTNTVDQPNSQAIGSNNKAGGIGAGGATAIGAYNDASGDNSTAIGTGDVLQSNIAAGVRTFAVGYKNACYNADDHAYGKNNLVAGGGSIAIGDGNTINDLASYALGQGHVINDDGVVAIGDGVVALVGARFTHALGSNCTLTALRSMALGQDADADIPGWVAFSSGKHTTAGDRQLYIGNMATDTVDATPTELLVRGFSDQIHMPNSSALTGEIHVSAYVTGGTGGNTDQAWGANGHFAVKCDSAGAMVSLGATWTLHNGDALSYAVSLDLTTNNVLRFNVRGGASDDVKWGATVDAFITKT